MNTNKLKAYAPKARLAFMDAVKKRAAVLGIYENKISEATTQGTDTLIEGRIFTRKQGQQRQQLVKRIEALGGGIDGYNQFINEMAFTWFNRFTAIRFMEVNGYLDHGFRMLSKEVGAEFGQGFEILAHAADVAEDLGLNKADIVEMLLAGDKEEELYRELLLAQCHQLSKIMPFMFEKLDDATELLLPDNLTKTDSILKELINDVPEDNWQEIEVIGWLYQFYISEHKDAVIGKVVKKEDIPAATQLFTPNWIVKYLVQNSLGRQWLATYPDSDLKEKMEYYITPAEQSDEVIEQLKAITPTSIDPEQIKVLDPACGSGHILVEVYEVLREIYLERGYRLREIPELILTKNIYGLDIDDRAAQMAAFAVLMKAREDDRRIFSRVESNHIKLNIHAVQSTEHLNINQLWRDLDLDGQKQAGSMDDLFAEPSNVIETSVENQQYLNLLRYLKDQFIDGKNLGSLIDVDSKYLDTLTNLKVSLEAKFQNSPPTVRGACEIILPIVEQACTLAIKYDVCVANPPYMGANGLNVEVKKYISNTYPNGKADLYSTFIERSKTLVSPQGLCAFVTMQGWMFLPSFEKMRSSLLTEKAIFSLAHLGGRAFPEISGEVVQTTAFILCNTFIKNILPSFIDLRDGNSNQKSQTIKNNPFIYNTTKQCDFLKYPRYQIIYWLPDTIKALFANANFVESVTVSDGQTKTGNNDKYIRHLWEVDYGKIGVESKWVKHPRGGGNKKWYGNLDSVVNWSKSAREHYRQDRVARIIPEYLWWREGVNWSNIATSGFLGFRTLNNDEIFNMNSPSLYFSEGVDPKYLIGYLNSSFCSYMVNCYNPTLHFNVADVQYIPYTECANHTLISDLSDEAIKISKKDWDLFECSFDFARSPLVASNKNSLKESVSEYVQDAREDTLRLQAIEEEINELVSSHLCLDQLISNAVSLDKVTLLRNPLWSISSKLDEVQAQDLLVSKAIVELLSYSVGCTMGRYSLSKKGITYAHSGNQLFRDLLSQDVYNDFPADDDGIVPLADEEWLFDDDATSRFRQFVKTVWGEEHLQENLDFVAESLCLDAIKPKKNESSMETIRRYFSTQFYKDHLKTYKKRPIYWLFSSGKEKAFECLVYLHRYNESTLARMRTEYVTPLMSKLETQHSVLTESRTNASSTEQRRIDKELKSIEKKQSELRAFDEELKHLAEMKISIDLDDGVKVNYGKFGNLLADVKAIHGKKPEEIK